MKQRVGVKRSTSLRHTDSIIPQEEKKFTQSAERVLPLLRTKSNNAANTIVTVAGKQSAKSKGLFAKFFSSDKKSKSVKKVVNVNDPSGDIKKLFSMFPSFPKKMMTCLLLRQDGNCYKVFKELSHKGWKSSDGSKKNPFRNKANKHLTVPYFFGISPSKSLIKSIFKDANVGSFITYFKYADKHSSKFSYVLCSKNVRGKIVEKYIDQFQIPDGNCASVHGGPLHDKRKRDLTWIPCFTR